MLMTPNDPGELGDGEDCTMADTCARFVEMNENDVLRVEKSLKILFRCVFVFFELDAYGKLVVIRHGKSRFFLIYGVKNFIVVSFVFNSKLSYFIRCLKSKSYLFIKTKRQRG